jgi:Sec-independent protein translocase protein TatA
VRRRRRVAARVAARVEYHPAVDWLAVLIVALVVVVIWRGPKTIPQIGAMLGRGVRAAREEANELRGDKTDRSDADKPPTP